MRAPLADHLAIEAPQHSKEIPCLHQRTTNPSISLDGSYVLAEKPSLGPWHPSELKELRLEVQTAQRNE